MQDMQRAIYITGQAIHNMRQQVPPGFMVQEQQESSEGGGMSDENYRISTAQCIIAELKAALEMVDIIRVDALETLSDLSEIDSSIVKGVISSYQGLDTAGNCDCAIDKLQEAAEELSK